MRSRHLDEFFLSQFADARRLSAELILRPFQRGDEAAILRAHAQAFSRDESRSLEHWRWQFERNPAGSQILLAFDSAGEVRGQYATLRQRVRSEVGTLHFAQSVDSFLARPQGSGLSRTSAFVRAGEAFCSRFCGAAPKQDHVVWGLANPAAWRSGSRRLGYEHVRTQNLLAAGLDELPQGLPTGFELQESESAPAEVAQLHERASASRGASAKRDEGWMRWRFSDKPDARYVFGALREGAQLRGVGVYRHGDFGGRSGGLVCDWIVPGQDDAARYALLAWFAQRGRASGARELIALLPDSAPEWLQFQRLGFRVAPTEYILAARCFHPALDREFLFQRWFYTLGDTDLV